MLVVTMDEHEAGLMVALKAAKKAVKQVD